MATGTIKKRVSFGAMTQVTFPFTAPSDGVLYYRFPPTSSSVTALVYLRMTSPITLQLAQHQSSNGVDIVSSFPVAKGWKIEVSYISGATFSTAYFLPLV